MLLDDTASGWQELGFNLGCGAFQALPPSIHTAERTCLVNSITSSPSRTHHPGTTLPSHTAVSAPFQVQGGGVFFHTLSLLSLPLSRQEPDPCP